MHDPKRYADPMTFNPDRFLATPERAAEHDPRDFAFGFGRRKCPGIFFAEASIFAAVALTLSVYNIEKAKDASGMPIEPIMKWTGHVIRYAAGLLS